MKIKRKGELRELLYHEGYDKIVFFADGDWENVTTSTVIEGPKVAMALSRSSFYDQTRKSIEEKIKEIESELNMGEDDVISEYEFKKGIEEGWLQ